MADEISVAIRASTAELRADMAQNAATVTSAVNEMTGALRTFAAQSQTHQRAVQEHAKTTASAFGDLRERVTVGLSGASAQIRAFGEAATAAFAILAGKRLFEDVIHDTQEWAFQVEALSHALGVSTETASGYAVAARESGVSTGTIETAIRGLVATLNTNKAAFANLGVEIVRNTHGNLDLDRTLLNVAHRLTEAAAGGDRLQAAMQLFRRATPEVIDSIVRWSSELDGARERADALGVTIGADGVTHAREYEKATADLSLALLGMKQVIAEALRPELEELIDHVVALAKDGTLKTWATEAADAVKSLGSGVKTGVEVFVEFERVIKAAAAAWVTYRGVTVTSEIIVALASDFKALAAALGLVAVAEDAATLGLTGVIRIIAVAVVSLVTFTGQWDKVRDAIMGAVHALADFTSEASKPPPRTADAVLRDARIIEDSYDRRIALAKQAGDAELAADIERQKVKALAANLPSQNVELPVPGEEAPLGFGPQLPGPGEPALGTGGRPTKPTPEPVQAGAAFEALEREKERELEAVKENAFARLAIEQDYTARVAALYGTQSAEYDKQLTAQAKAQEAATTQERKLVEENAQAELKAKVDQLDAEKAAIEEQKRAGQITQAEEFDALKALLAKKLALQEDYYRHALALEVGGAEQANALQAAFAGATTPEAKAQVVIDAQVKNPEAVEKLLQEIDALGPAGEKAMAALAKMYDPAILANERFASEVRDAFTTIFDDIDRGFQQVVQGILSGTTTAAQAIRQAETSLAAEGIATAEHFVAEVIKLQLLRVAAEVTGNRAILAEDKLSGAQSLALKLGDWARELLGFKSKEAIKTTAQVVGDQTRTASAGTAAAEKEGIETAATGKSLAMSAADAAGKVIAAFASLPYGVGIALGVAAAAGVTALILGLMGKFEGGGEVESDMLAMLHPGERVLPPVMAAGIRRLIQTPSGAALLGGGGVFDTPRGGPTSLAAGSMVLPAGLAGEVRGGAPGRSGGALRASSTRPAGVTSRDALSAILGTQVDEGPVTAAVGIERVGADNTLAILHEGEQVKPATPTEPFKGEPGGPTLEHEKGGGAAGLDAKGGAKDGKVEHTGTITQEHKGAVTPPNFAITGFGGASGGGGAKVQDVKIVASTPTVSTKVASGTVTASITKPVTTVPAGSSTPVEEQGVKNVIVVNKVPVSFSAIQTMFSLSTSIAPFGIGVIVSAGFGTLTAFEQGGDVPEDMLAKLHNREMVLPADIAEPLRLAIRRPEGIAVGGPDIGASLASIRRSTETSAAPARAEPPAIVEQHNHAWNVQTIDAASFEDRLAKDGARVIRQQVNEAMRNRERTVGRRL